MPGVIDPAALFAPLDHHARLGLAVSGGADSLALMLLAAEYGGTRGTLSRFIVYSVDHGLRPEAADEVAFVLGEARRLGLAARGLRWAGPHPETGIQQAARQARYRLMGAAMAEDGATVLVTAHHLRDQAETVLMRLAHGSGTEGLRGMDALSVVEGVSVARPLLCIDPAALAGLVAEAGLKAVRDPSNTDRSYERVRWREALPLLGELGLGPARLARFAERMRDADAAIEAAAGVVLATVTRGEGEARLDAGGFARLPRAVAVRVLSTLLSEIGSSKKPHALAAVERLADRLQAGPVRTTLHGCRIAAPAETITFQREGPRRRSSAAARATKSAVTPY